MPLPFQDARTLADGARGAARTRTSRSARTMEPTLVSVKPGQSLRCDEVFGPVMAVRPAAGYDEAAGPANDCDYGLSAAVFTTSLGRAYEFIDRAETGQVSVNLPTSGWNVHHLFRGFRDSGSPVKEQGAPGLRFCTRVKTAAVRFAS